MRKKIRLMLYYFLKLSDKRQQTLIEIAKDMLNADMLCQGGGYLTCGQDELFNYIERDHENECGHIYKEEPGR